jgi:pimeloyl-ACP methyl ester carboxylesterase
MCFALAGDAQQSTSPASRSGSVLQGDASSASRARGAANTTIVLVHGAFADALGWQDVIPLLQREGYKVIAVENPLLSADQDVETTRRAITRETEAGRDVVAVGHSYGGFVISGAAAGNPKVKALVYVAAFAPEANERVDAFLQQYPSDLGTALVPDASGFLYIDDAKFHDVFAGDLPERLTRVAAAAQKPIAAASFGATIRTDPAWKTIPSWYVVSRQDHALNPELERFYARRIKARTTELNASHVGFISRPKEVARVILDAAASVQK